MGVFVRKHRYCTISEISRNTSKEFLISECDEVSSVICPWYLIDSYQIDTNSNITINKTIVSTAILIDLIYFKL